MEMRWKFPHREYTGRLAGSLLTFALTLGLVITAPGLDGAARAVDLSAECSLKVAPVDPANTELSEDLRNARITIDLYKVADAEEVSGYDAYTYKFAEGYQKLEEIYKKDPDNAEWKEMAQEAAAYVREHTGGENALQPDKSGEISEGGVDITGLESGLYLLIARESGAEDYWTVVEQEDGTSENIATVAHSDRYRYTYAPELISLPGREGNTTAGDGAWLNDVVASLKPEQDMQNGSLEIVKTLERYEMGNPATFVFRVTAALGDNIVFRDDVALTFTDEDTSAQKSIVLEDRIPVGAVVTVEEVYSGAVYELVSEREQTAVIEAGNMASVAFANDYNGEDRGGGSVINSFSQTDDGWTLRQVYDDGRVVENGE